MPYFDTLVLLVGEGFDRDDVGNFVGEGVKRDSPEGEGILVKEDSPEGEGISVKEDSEGISMKEDSEGISVKGTNNPVGAGEFVGGTPVKRIIIKF